MRNILSCSYCLYVVRVYVQSGGCQLFNGLLITLKIGNQALDLV